MYMCTCTHTLSHSYTLTHTHSSWCSRLDPNLWVQALTYFASQELEECKSKIQEVLEHIDEHHLMPPLMVVQTLSESKCATLSDIKVKAFSSGWRGGGGSNFDLFHYEIMSFTVQID